MGMFAKQLKEFIQEVLALAPVPLNSPEAVKLLMGTAAQESHLGYYLEQLVGPAESIFQIEPDTALDIETRIREPLRSWVRSYRDDEPIKWALSFRLDYAIAMCRLKYFMCPGAIPPDLPGQAAYWKKYYNTPLGRGTVQEYLANYAKYVRDV
jgi:hypothetical protein